MEILRYFHNTTLNISDSKDYFSCIDMVYVWIWGFISILCFVFGMPASVAVFWELFKKHKAGSPTTPNDVFVHNITLMDMVFLVSMPSSVFNYIVWHNLHIELFNNSLYCLSISGRPLLMVCMCLDCYVAVVHPFVYRTRKSLAPRVALCVVVWIATIAYGSCFIQNVSFYLSPYLMIPIALAVPLIGFFDVLILLALKKPNSGKQGQVHPQKLKALQVIVNSLIITIATGLLPLVIQCFKSLCPRENQCNFGILSVLPPTIGSAIIPILYLYNLEKLKWFC